MQRFFFYDDRSPASFVSSQGLANVFVVGGRVLSV